MAKRLYPSNDADFAVWAANLIKKATDNKAALDLSDARLAALEGKITNFDENLALKRRKKDESKAQTTLVKGLRSDLNGEMSLLNSEFKAIDDLPPDILEEMGLTPNKKRSASVAPFEPSELIVSGTSDGVNSLKWNRNGNRPGTMFIIEARIGEADDWAMIDVVTGSTYKHRNQKPGVTAQYRVKAKRGELESGSSNMAVVYG